MIVNEQMIEAAEDALHDLGVPYEATDAYTRTDMARAALTAALAVTPAPDPARPLDAATRDAIVAEGQRLWPKPDTPTEASAHAGFLAGADWAVRFLAPAPVSAAERESIERGLAQSAAGDVVDLGDFTQHTPAPEPCGFGVCAANAGHAGTCAEASGWDAPDALAQVAALAVLRARGMTDDQIRVRTTPPEEKP